MLCVATCYIRGFCYIIWGKARAETKLKIPKPFSKKCSVFPLSELMRGIGFWSCCCHVNYTAYGLLTTHLCCLCFGIKIIYHPFKLHTHDCGILTWFDDVFLLCCFYWLVVYNFYVRINMHAMLLYKVHLPQNVPCRLLYMYIAFPYTSNCTD